MDGDGGRSSSSSIIGGQSSKADVTSATFDRLSINDTKSDEEAESEKSDEEAESEKSGSNTDWNELTVEQVLDVPIWSGVLQTAKFDDLMSFEDFLMRSQNVLQLELASHDYDTFTSFIDFYRSYKDSGKNFVSFVSGYNDGLLPSLHGDGLSCVGLSIRLVEKLSSSDPRIRRNLALVSCEEVVKDIGSYCMQSPNALKEHVLLALHVLIDGNRSGYVLFDPGYHVARPSKFSD